MGAQDLGLPVEDFRFRAKRVSLSQFMGFVGHDVFDVRVQGCIHGT